MVKTGVQHNSVGSASACCYGRPEFWARIFKPYKEPRNRFPARRACTARHNYLTYRPARVHRLGGGASNRVFVPARHAGIRFLGSLKGLQIRTLFTARHWAYWGWGDGPWRMTMNECIVGMGCHECLFKKTKNAAKSLKKCLSTFSWLFWCFVGSNWKPSTDFGDPS